MWRSPREYIANELTLTVPAGSHVSCSSNLDGFRDGWLVFVQLLLFGMLPPGLVQYSSQHSGAIAVKLSLHTLSGHVVHPYSSIDTTDSWKKLLFILSDRSNIHMTDSLSITVHTFTSCVLMSFSVDETLLPRLNLSTSFIDQPFSVEMS